MPDLTEQQRIAAGWCVPMYGTCALLSGHTGPHHGYPEDIAAILDRDRAEQDQGLRAEGAYRAMWSFFLTLPHSPMSDAVQREALRLRALLDAHPSQPNEAESRRAMDAKYRGQVIEALLAALGLTDETTPEEAAALLDGCDCNGEEGTLHLIWHLAQKAQSSDAKRVRDAALDMLREATIAEIEAGHPCRLDHHGDCQEHGYHDGPCLIPRARALLAGHVPQPSDAEVTVERVRALRDEWTRLSGFPEHVARCETTPCALCVLGEAAGDLAALLESKGAAHVTGPSQRVRAAPDDRTALAAAIEAVLSDHVLQNFDPACSCGWNWDPKEVVLPSQVDFDPARYDLPGTVRPRQHRAHVARVVLADTGATTALTARDARVLRDAAEDLDFVVARSAVITERAECHKRQCSCGHPSEDRLLMLVADRFREALRVRADSVEHSADSIGWGSDDGEGA